MRKAVLVFVVFLLVVSTSWAEGPEGMSPSGQDVAVVGTVCPTFSWSEVEGAEGYIIEVYEVTEDVQSHEEVASTSEPVISKDVDTALSWTPSGGECFEDGVRYGWYVGARKSEVKSQESGVKSQEVIWSEGMVFEVSLLTGTEEVEATKELVRNYLQTEWLDTESFEVVKERIKEEITDSGSIAAERQIGIMGNEGDDNLNTYYGTGAGSSLPSTAYHNAFFGY